MGARIACLAPMIERNKMLQLDLFETEQTNQPAGHALAEKFPSTPVGDSVQESSNGCSGKAVQFSETRFAGASKRLLSLAQWRCPDCKAIHHYWPAKSDCQRCHAVVSFVPANQAAETIFEWVNR